MGRKLLASRLALVVGSLALALIILEILTRCTALAPPQPTQYSDNVRDQYILYRRQPGSVVDGRSESGEFSFHYEHNQLGFRDSDHPFTKPPGSTRIVALGDSFTYGVGAAADETYLAHVAKRLRARAGEHGSVEIINLALPRQFPALERMTLEKFGLAFSPDIVTVALLPNDIVDTYLGPADICLSTSGYFVPCYAESCGEIAVWLYRHLALARIALTALRPSEQSPPFRMAFQDNGPYEAAWRTVEDELARMQSLAKEHGSTFVVIAIPQQGPWGPENYFEQRLARWCERRAAVFVPTRDALQAAGTSRPLYWERDGHCTPAGYAIIGETVARALIAHGLVP